jgi:hypothetical protein
MVTTKETEAERKHEKELRWMEAKAIEQGQGGK